MALPPMRHDGRRELRSARSSAWKLYTGVGIFSFAVNLLMLTGPLFMMQVYDRVLASRSVETLTALFLLVVFLFTMMGALDLARNRIMSRIAARFQERMEGRVFTAALQDGNAAGSDLILRGGMRDLEAVQRLIGSPVLMALFDLPWAPFFLAAVFLFHPVLGAVASAGLVILVISTLLNQWLSRDSLQEAAIATQASERMSDLLSRRGRADRLAGHARCDLPALAGGPRPRDRCDDPRRRPCHRLYGIFPHLPAVFAKRAAGRRRLAGAAPGGDAGGDDRLVDPDGPGARADRTGGRRLVHGAARPGRLEPPVRALVTPPAPAAAHAVASAAGPARGQEPDRGAARPEHGDAARGQLRSGTGSGAGGHRTFGAGKSTLARALISAWPISGGSIRLDGATLEQYDPDVLGSLIGYLPQQVTLFDGTIAENIARLSPSPDPARVVAAATAAAAHRMILDLPQGYDTRVTQGNGRLSGGQIQRIGLARALYADPAIFVLDEPNSNLDNEGQRR